MARKIRIAAAQMGATHRTSSRPETLKRMIALLEEAAASKKAEVVLFPELAFTTFFPRYLIEDETELNSFFEHGDISKSSQTSPLFDKARELGVDISVGFAEATDKNNNGEHFNTCVYYHAKSGSILSTYRKVHLPGDVEPFSDPDATNQLEKRYFQPGNLGFEAFRVPDLAEKMEPVFGMMICNDRRWPEAWRCYGLQGVEVILCGYNTAGFAPHLWGADRNQDPEAAEQDALFHHKLTMQSNSYMNATFSVCAARCGMDDGKYNLIGGSCIVDPEGKILAEAQTKEDEVIIADCDLEKCRQGKTRTFDFARHRRTEHYRRITDQTGVVEPPRLDEQRRKSRPVIAIPAKPVTHSRSGGEVAGVREIEDSPSRRTSTAPRPSIPPPPPPPPTANLTTSTKTIRILLVNPNATESMTNSCIQTATATLPPDVSLYPFTGPPNQSPLAIESTTDAILSSAACIRSLIPLLSRQQGSSSSSSSSYDAILVACYSDHPLIKSLREEFTLPTIGIMEASLLHARTIGSRFGIIATSQRSKTLHQDAVRAYGFSDSCVGIASCDVGVLDLERRPRGEIVAIMRDTARKLILVGADVLTLGCAGMTEMKDAVEEAVRDEGVQVVDGVVAGVHHLVGVVRSGGKTSKKGAYRSSKEGREKRGQEYI